MPTLYCLKGEIVRRGVRAVTGLDMPVFPKRRFQHGAVPVDVLRTRLRRATAERRSATYRRQFQALYA